MKKENVRDYIVIKGNNSACIVVESKNNNKTHLEKIAEAYEVLQKEE